MALLFGPRVQGPVTGGLPVRATLPGASLALPSSSPLTGPVRGFSAGPPEPVNLTPGVGNIGKPGGPMPAQPALRPNPGIGKPGGPMPAQPALRPNQRP